MTKQELNRDIKRLWSKYYDASFQSCEEFYKVEPEIIKEFNRLYYADREFEYLTAQSIKMMLRMNLRFRVVALHQFGLQIKI